jgi:hypothetical protein
MNKKGQNFLEYALVIGCVAIALFAMQAYFKRGIQGVVKTTSDDLASPVADYYLQNQNKQVNPQLLGAVEPDLLEYKQTNPTSITQDQEIVVTELEKGDREKVINKDVTTTSGNWTVRYRSHNLNDYGDQADKSLKPTEQEAHQAQ